MKKNILLLSESYIAQRDITPFYYIGIPSIIILMVIGFFIGHDHD